MFIGIIIVVIVIIIIIYSAPNGEAKVANWDSPRPAPWTRLCTEPETLEVLDPTCTRKALNPKP